MSLWLVQWWGSPRWICSSDRHLCHTFFMCIQWLTSKPSIRPLCRNRCGTSAQPSGKQRRERCGIVIEHANIAGGRGGDCGRKCKYCWCVFLRWKIFSYMAQKANVDIVASVTTGVELKIKGGRKKMKRIAIRNSNKWVCDQIPVILYILLSKYYCTC